MRPVLLDESVPAGLGRLLSGFEARTVPEMGWAGISTWPSIRASTSKVNASEGDKWANHSLSRHVNIRR